MEYLALFDKGVHGIGDDAEQLSNIGPFIIALLIVSIDLIATELVDVNLRERC